MHEGHIQFVKAVLHHIKTGKAKSGEEKMAETTTVHDTPTAPTPLVVFELAILNADKPAMPRVELQKRLDYIFSPENTAKLESCGITNFAVSVTNRPLFLDKSELFSNCIFPVGVDTFIRLLDPKYYNHSEAQMLIGLTRIAARGVRFVVGGRSVVVGGEGGKKEFQVMEDALRAASIADPRIPLGEPQFFTSLSEEEFRVDLSSTELRARAQSSTAK